MNALSTPRRVFLGFIFSLPLALSVNAIEPGQPDKASLPSEVEIGKLLKSLDSQIHKVDQLIVSMENQVEAQYQQINETDDYTVRTQLEAVAVQMGEKLMQMQELQEQMLRQRNQTEELMHGIQNNE